MDLPYGENLAFFYGLALEAGVDMWYGEESAYDYGKPGYSEGTGHFTQLVWRGTCRVGWGSAKDKRGATFFVMLYDPPGNYEGEFGRNVFKRGTAVDGPCALPVNEPPRKPQPPPTPSLGHLVKLSACLVSGTAMLLIFCFM